MSSQRIKINHRKFFGKFSQALAGVGVLFFYLLAIALTIGLAFAILIAASKYVFSLPGAVPVAIGLITLFVFIYMWSFSFVSSLITLEEYGVILSGRAIYLVLLPAPILMIGFFVVDALGYIASNFQERGLRVFRILGAVLLVAAIASGVYFTTF